MKHRIANAITDTGVDHNSLDLSKYEYIYPASTWSKSCEDPYIFCCSCFCPLLTISELVKHIQPVGFCKHCGTGVGTILHLMLPMCLIHPAPFLITVCCCYDKLPPCIFAKIMDNVYGQYTLHLCVYFLLH